MGDTPLNLVPAEKMLSEFNALLSYYGSIGALTRACDAMQALRPETTFSQCLHTLYEEKIVMENLLRTGGVSK